MTKPKIAVVGATGLVGRTFLKIMEEKHFEADISLFASIRSRGRCLSFGGQRKPVQVLSEKSFDEGFDIALFSAGSAVSEKYAPIAAAKGTTVIDNSSRWRMEPGVPLVIPEVNPGDISLHRGIIANPNCSTIEAVTALAPLHREYGIKRISYTTFQAVSGAGAKGCKALDTEIRKYTVGETNDSERSFFGNCIPHIDDFCADGYTKEEHKMRSETQKILHDDSIALSATCVRVPVFNCHSESISIELKKPFEINDVRKLLSTSAGITVLDDCKNALYPLASRANGSDSVFVGRIRRDLSSENGLILWVVADNIRKGAATNAVQIAEILLKETL